MQITYMVDSDKAYVFDSLMRLSIGEIIDIEQSMRWGVVLSIWTEAVQIENKASSKKWNPLRIDLAPMGRPMGREDLKKRATKPSQTKSNQVNSNQNSSKEEWEQALVVQQEFRNEEINDLLEIIQWQVEHLGLIYRKWKYERERAKNILSWKEFWEICEKANMSRIEFCKQIIFISSRLDFWNGKVYNAETVYKHYAQVYNDAVNKKSEIENRPRRGTVV